MPGQVVEEFKDWVRKGLYKKISIALNDNMGLRHIGFLGGRAPAIKGLKPATFGEGKAAWTFEMEIPCLPDDSGYKQNFTKTINKGGKKMTIQGFIEKMKGLFVEAEQELAPPPHVGNPGAKFTEADLSAKMKEIETQTFAEAQKKINIETEARKVAEGKLKDIETKSRKESIAAFCEAQCKEGKLTPALRKRIEPVMIFAANHEDAIEFAEGEKKTPIEALQSFMSALPKMVVFSEVAGKEKDGPTGGSAGEKLTILTHTKMKEKKDLSFSAAFSEVQKENPGLVEEYALEIHPALRP